MSAGTDIFANDKYQQVRNYNKVSWANTDVMSGTEYLPQENNQILDSRDFTTPFPDFGKWERELLRNYLGPIGTIAEHYEVGNTAALPEYSGDINQKVEALFIVGKEEVFEDGMESEFSKRLVSIIRKYGSAAIEAIAYPILHEEANPEVASEALHWLGHIDHAPTYDHRLRLLEQSLSCSSARVRDSAAVGLAYLDDPRAIPHLKQAIQREQCEELREDMKQVLEQLLETSASASHPEKDKEVQMV